MSELKARRAYFSEDDYERGTHKICAKVSDCGYDRKNDWWSYAFEDEVYIKSEADKVIADLEESHKKEVEQLLILNREQAISGNKLRDSIEQALRHQKYKRCLTMAKWCEERYKYLTCLENWQMTDKEYQQVIGDYWDRWHKHWLKIAEQFKDKEAKQ